MRNKLSSLSAGTKTLKRLLLFVAIFAIISSLWNGVMGSNQETYSETVPGIRWEKKNGTWYIYWGTIRFSGWTGDISDDASYSRSTTIYCPNKQCQVEGTYSAGNSEIIIEGYANYYINDQDIATKVNDVSNVPYDNITLPASTTDLKYGWQSWRNRMGIPVPHVAKKEMTVKVLLPYHVDYNASSSFLGTEYLGELHDGKVSAGIDLSQYIKSYYISSNINLTLSNNSGGTFSFANGTQSTTLATTTSSDGDAVYANVTSKGKSFTIGSIPMTMIVFEGDGNLSTTAQCTLTITDQFNVTHTLTIKAEPSRTYIFETSGDWGNLSNWKKNNVTPSALPSTADAVSIQAACTISGKADCGSLEIWNHDENEASVTVNSSATLVVSGTLNNTTPKFLNIKASATNSGTVIFNNVSTCNGGVCENGPYATVEMYIPQTTVTASTSQNWKDYIWRYMGSPVETGSPSDVQYIFQWDESDSVDGDEDGWTECWQQVGNTITAWTGYAMGSTASPIHTITGKLTNCDVDIDMDFGTADHNHADKGNNLITNSYAAPIKLSELTTADFGGADATIYFFNSGTHADWVENAKEGGFNVGDGAPGTFVTCPISSTSTVTIPSGQAFFVKANDANQQFHFRYETVDGSASGAAYAPRKQEEFNVLGISVVGTDSLGDLLWLMENENCSEKFDNGYDGVKMLGVEGTPQLYATTEFGRTSVNVDQTLTGQYLGFMAGKQGVHYTIYFNTDRLEGYESLYLYDTKENKYANIMKGESYTFTGLRSGEEKRFLIVGQRDEEEDDVVVRTGDEQRIEVVGNRALVMGFDGSDSDVRVIDMQGKVVCTWSMKEGPWFELPDLPGGVYVISVDKCQTKFVK